MSNKDLCKGKQLKIEDRLIIEYGLDKNYTLKEIAKMVKKDSNTISKEIKLNRFIKASKRKENDLHSWQHRKNCTKTNLCNNSYDKQCKKCRFINCYRTCNEYCGYKIDIDKIAVIYQDMKKEFNSNRISVTNDILGIFEKEIKTISYVKNYDEKLTRESEQQKELGKSRKKSRDRGMER